MAISIKEHICECGRKSKGYKQCGVCRQKKYAEKSANRKNEKAEQEDNSDLKSKLLEKDNTNELQLWFEARREEMTGVCLNCKKSSTKHSHKYWKWGIAHLLPKAHFISIKTNKDNWIELCIECHQTYDRNWHTAEKMEVFKIAKQKYLLLEDKISKNEIRRIPNCFLSS